MNISPLLVRFPLAGGLRQANWLEYDSATRSYCQGRGEGKTEDAVVRAEQLVYNEETDEALFTENVVEFSDGT